MTSKWYKRIGTDGIIARTYDSNARKYGMKLPREWADRLAQQIQEGINILEVTPGPGYPANEVVTAREVQDRRT